MKKLFLSIIFFVFAALTVQTLYAQTSENPTTSTKVQYDLAFPGLLPDHPLYKLKVLRDRFTAYLIKDPIKKANFYLLQTDKGILASAILVDKNKIGLAKETLLKAEHNFTLLTYELSKLNSKPNSDFLNKLETASLKHQEIIKSLENRVSEKDKKTFDQVLDYSKTNLNTVKKFKNKRFFEIQ